MPVKNNVSAQANDTPLASTVAYTDEGMNAPQAEETFFSAPPSAPDSGIDETRIALLYRMGRAAYLVSPVYAGIVLIILWRETWADALIAWFGALLAVTAGQVLVHAGYLRERHSRPRVWERRFALGAFALGAAWAAVPMLFFAPEDPMLLAVVVLVIGGSLIAAAGLFAASALAMVAYALAPLVGLTGQLAVQAESTYRYFALAVVLFAVVIVRMHRELNHNLVETLQARQDNERLRAHAQESEARMRDAIASLPEAIAIFDDAETLIGCNEAYARRYGSGRSRAALSGTPYADLCAEAFEIEEPLPAGPGVREAWIETRRREAREGRGLPRLFRSREGRWFQARLVRTTFGGFVSTLSDVTELKSAQDAYLGLLAQEDLVLSTLPVGVAFVEGGRIGRCNARLEQMLGYASGELQGRETGLWAASQDDWAALWREFESRMAASGTFEGEVELARRDGSRLWCQVIGRQLNAASAQAGAVLAFSDIGERRSAERALRASETLYRDLVEASSELIWSIDRDARWTFLNASAARRVYRCEPADLLGQPIADVLAPQVRARDLAVLRRVLEGEPVFDFETRHRRRDGSTVDLSLNAVPVRDARGEIRGATGTAHDVSARKRAAAALYDTVEKLRLAVDLAGLYYWEWDADSNLLRYGHDPRTTSASTHGTALPWTEYANWVHPEDRERFLASGVATVERGEPYACEYRIGGSGGTTRWIAARGQPAFDASGRVHRIIGVSQDVTERKRSEDEARFHAHHDTLTGLPNHRLLDDRLRQAIHLAQRRDARAAVMRLDLDGFREINDRVGHRAGDEVLREVTRRLAGCLRKADTLARQGGDEFVIVIPQMQLQTDCQTIAQKILRVFEREFRVEGGTFRVGASIGIALYPTDAADAEELLRNADVAMVRAKRDGGGGYGFYAR